MFNPTAGGDRTQQTDRLNLRNNAHKGGIMRLRQTIGLALSLVLASPLLGWGTSNAPLGIEVKPTGKLQISVQMDRGKFGATYRIGETAKVLYTVTAQQRVPCVYVYLFDVDAQGTVRLIFPNAFSTNNCVKAGNQHVVPDNPTYELRVVPPAGQEAIQAFASLRPLDVKKLTNETFPLIGNTVEQARQSVENAILGVIPVKKKPGDKPQPGQVATDHTSFRVVNR